MAKSYQMARSAELSSLAALRGLVDQACREHGIDDATAYDLKLALDEACSNVIQYGYSGMNAGSVILRIEVQPNEVIMTLTDFGHAFEPVEKPLPDVNAIMEGDEKAGGFGLYIIHQTMDDVRYESDGVENKLILTRRH